MLLQKIIVLKEQEELVIIVAIDVTFSQFSQFSPHFFYKTWQSSLFYVCVCEKH